MKATAAVATLALLLAGSAEPPDSPVDRMLREDFSCDQHSAQFVDIENLTSHPDRYFDLCIKSTGEFAGRWFVKNLKRVEATPLDELVLKQAEIIGLQFNPHDPEPAQRSVIEIVGRVRSCGARSDVFYEQAKAQHLAAGDTSPPPPPMLAEACHYMNVAVFVSSWHVIRPLQ